MSLFDDADLTTDADLANWESKMPALAISRNVYQGKRLLAKNFILKQLLKLNIDPATLTDPTQLCDAATFKELELLFRDLSEKPDSIAGTKANYYLELFDSEMELILLKATSSGGDKLLSMTCSSIPLRRA